MAASGRKLNWQHSVPELESGNHPQAPVLFMKWVRATRSQRRRMIQKLTSDLPVLDHQDIVSLNISGNTFETFGKTLAKFPDTLLGNVEKRKAYFVQDMGQYFFNRHRESFEAILYFYQSDGRLYRPATVPLHTFIAELEFFGLLSDSKVMKRFWKNEGAESETDEQTSQSPAQRVIWNLFERPESSIFAQITAGIGIAFLLTAIVSLCLETMPSMQVGNCSPAGHAASKLNFACSFTVIEFTCLMWFSVEFILRFISCPSKWDFCKSPLNIIDCIAIVPFYVNIFVSGDGAVFSVLRSVRLIRILSIFKLSRHCRGLKVLSKTLRECRRDFFLLSFFLLIITVLFASAMFFAEMGHPKKFSSIPDAFWFAIVTLTSVGYGDVSPTHILGKIVSSIFMAIGILVCALPMVVIVEKFDFFYRQEAGLTS